MWFHNFRVFLALLFLLLFSSFFRPACIYLFGLSYLLREMVQIHVDIEWYQCRFNVQNWKACIPTFNCEEVKRMNEWNEERERERYIFILSLTQHQTNVIINYRFSWNFQTERKIIISNGIFKHFTPLSVLKLRLCQTKISMSCFSFLFFTLSLSFSYAIMSICHTHCDSFLSLSHSHIHTHKLSLPPALQQPPVV